MTKKTVKKTKVKKVQQNHEKEYLMNVIKLLDKCSEDTKNTDLEEYFKRKADLNRKRLKDLN
jgi:hypothetical protein